MSGHRLLKMIGRGAALALLGVLSACGGSVKYAADGGQTDARLDGPTRGRTSPDADGADLATVDGVDGADTANDDLPMIDAPGLDAADAGDVPDHVAPFVVSTNPSSAAVGVRLDQTITATFSEAMDPSTLNAATFTLAQGTTAVAGVVSSAGSMATFSASSNLAAGVTFTATLRTGAKDLAGNPLASDHAWSFTTAACGQTPVALRSAASFAVLAGPTITNTGLSVVKGDVGVSPGATITGFAAGSIVGFQHAGDAVAAQAQADAKMAYDDAAGRTLCPIATVGNLGGKTLGPGLYTSPTSLEISAGDLTLDAGGDPNAIFVFQMTTTLTTTAGRKVLLAGSASAANVFWQVGSAATLGSTTDLEGTILALQSITVATGATVHGRLLARIAAITLDTDTVATP